MQFRCAIASSSRSKKKEGVTMEACSDPVKSD